MRTISRYLFVISFAITLLVLITAFSPVSEINRKVPDIISDHWINTSPLNWNKLKGKVVLVEFWTFECYNCKNVEPYVKNWYKKLKPQGLEIIAIHSPEFSHERNIDNVERYVKENNITYPVAIDNDFSNWKRFSNRYWPAMYLVDKKGIIRYRYIGEGNYEQIERNLKSMLAEQYLSSAG